MYDSKFLQHPDKLRMHWLGPLIIQEVMEAQSNSKRYKGNQLKGILMVAH